MDAVDGNNANGSCGHVDSLSSGIGVGLANKKPRYYAGLLIPVLITCPKFASHQILSGELLCWLSRSQTHPLLLIHLPQNNVC